MSLFANHPLYMNIADDILSYTQESWMGDKLENPHLKAGAKRNRRHLNQIQCKGSKDYTETTRFTTTSSSRHSERVQA